MAIAALSAGNTHWLVEQRIKDSADRLLRKCVSDGTADPAEVLLGREEEIAGIFMSAKPLRGDSTCAFFVQNYSYPDVAVIIVGEGGVTIPGLAFVCQIDANVSLWEMRYSDYASFFHLG